MALLASICNWPDLAVALTDGAGANADLKVDAYVILGFIGTFNLCIMCNCAPLDADADAKET